MSPILLFGWLLAITLFFLGEHLMYGVIAILAVTAYGTIGNFAAFFEIASGLRLDGRSQAIRLLAINIFNFMISLISVSRATFAIFAPLTTPGQSFWYKTERFRKKPKEKPKGKK